MSSRTLRQSFGMNLKVLLAVRRSRLCVRFLRCSISNLWLWGDANYGHSPHPPTTSSSLHNRRPCCSQAEGGQLCWAPEGNNRMGMMDTKGRKAERKYWQQRWWIWTWRRLNTSRVRQRVRRTQRWQCFQSPSGVELQQHRQISSAYSRVTVRQHEYA